MTFDEAINEKDEILLIGPAEFSFEGKIENI